MNETTLVEKVTKQIKDSFGDLFGGKPLPGTAITGSDDWSAFVPSGSSVDLTVVAHAAIATVLREMLDGFHILGSIENDKIWKDTLRAFAAVHGIELEASDG